MMPFVCYSQDIITLRDGERIDCKITNVDSSMVYYDFYKGTRKLSSYILKDNIRSYEIKNSNTASPDSNETAMHPDNKVVIDTSKYVKETNQWINLITYSQRYGLHANGWAVQYYGYNLTNTSKWAVPIIFGVETFELNSGYFSQFAYQSVDMGYFLVGMSPFYQLYDKFFLNIGMNIILGQEVLTSYFETESTNTLFGMASSQGLYFIPKSKVGLTLGIGIYEKLLSSEIYDKDVGVKLELGIKF